MGKWCAGHRKGSAVLPVLADPIDEPILLDGDSGHARANWSQSRSCFVVVQIYDDADPGTKLTDDVQEWAPGAHSLTADWAPEEFHQYHAQVWALDFPTHDSNQWPGS